MRRAKTIRFNHPYESVLYVARQNENWFNDQAALRLYREALGHARNEDERAFCQGKIAFLSAEIRRGAAQGEG